MPDDVGGRPFPDGWEPDDDRGGADEDFASVVFDEDFVRAARFHEPTAVERLVAAAQARGRRTAQDSAPHGLHDPYAPAGHPGGHGDDPYGSARTHDPYGPYGGALRPYRPGGRWYRPVAWIVALLMGLGMVVLALSAVYRSASSADRDEQIPAPATTDLPPGDGDALRGPAPAPPPPATRHSAP
ncbi:hypothetical protein BJP40_12545 [Streptomyces sp. CC53]|uniref:SCO2584 family spore wall biosynthesis protein n=1 Tax=unclassified Streptomyces TaxID=2593676 RepID=UPI0008DCACD6|nr:MULTISPECIES: hypothetical protein [unclassified Streptomyces]OII59860.1 hypothetical protein BJP40_12545 [Streptomyces sp. CC53]